MLTRSLVTSTLCVLALAAGAALLEPPPASAQEAESGVEEEVSSEWLFPKKLVVGGRALRLFEPAVESFDGETRKIALRFALEVTDGLGRKGYGSVAATATAALDLDSRLVLVQGIIPGETSLDLASDDDEKAVREGFAAKCPKRLLLRLELLTSRPGAAPEATPNPGKLSALAPVVHVRRTPAVLVQVDGDPEMLPLADFPMEYVANSATNVVHDLGEKRWLMLLDGFWAQAEALTGPWTWMEGKMPIVLTQLDVGHPRGHIRRFIPGTPEYRKVSGGRDVRKPQGEIAEVIVETVPAELVLLKGDPLFTMVSPTLKLQLVANTESDLLFHPKTGVYYLLLSGRWFQAEDVLGEWKAVFGDLPAEFKSIPRNHRLAHVLSSVPGTPEADQAAVRAMLEERVTVKHTSWLSVKHANKKMRLVPLQGVDDAKVATSTEDDVFKVEGAYYACGRGIWFSSPDSKTRWKPTAAVPEVLRGLSASTGFLHDNFCRALGEVEDGFRFAVSSGYSGVFLHRGVPLHGTGWAKNGIMRSKNWYPRPRTYGENRWYDVRSGSFQPRTVRYDGEGRPVASIWSDYTASYGRVRHYAVRYHQGGRRMFTFRPDKKKFDRAAPRPDIYGTWGTDVTYREGLPTDRFPLGDRTADAFGDLEILVAAPDGAVHRIDDGKAQTWKDGAWVASATPQPWLAVLSRLNAAPDDWNAWRTKRMAALPVNPEVTPR